MKSVKKIFFIIMIIIFIWIDCFTAVSVFQDWLIPTTTIDVTSQNEDIVKKIKQHFNITYEIKKIQYSRGFPDGYGLIIYDSYGVEDYRFEDEFEGSEIDAYFQKLDEDTPKYLMILILEIIFETFVIIAVIRRNKNINE